MKKRVFIFKVGSLGVLLLFISTYLTAQAGSEKRQITITGIIKKENNETGSFISLLFIRSKDSVLLKGTMSDVSGRFNLLVSIDTGAYNLYISQLKSLTLIKQINFSGPHPDSIIDLGVITINESIKTLEEITVKGRKPLLVRKLDRLEFDVSNSVLSKGYNTLEVLSKLPGVNVDALGNISVNGKSDIYLLIDGKGQFLRKEQVQSILGSLRAENVDRVEIISNPSAKYDAQGSAVINIITKKDKAKSDLHITYGNQIYPYENVNGFNYNLFNIGTNLSYSFDKLKTYASIDLTVSDEYRNHTAGLLVIPARSLQRNNENLDLYKEVGLNYRAGFNYDINKKNSFDLAFNSFGSPSKKYNSTNSNFYKQPGNGSPDSTYIMKGTLTNSGSRFNSVIGKYTFKIDSLGKTLFAFFDYSGANNPTGQVYNGSYLYKNIVRDKYDIFSFDRKYKVNIYSFHIDYEQPLKKNSFIEGGIKITKIINHDNSSLQYTLKDGPSFVQTASTSKFKYDELVSGFYVNVRKNLKKIRMQAGLRGENTISEGKIPDPEISLRRTYFNIFPSAALQYNYNDKNQFGLNYSMRIVRPGYADFNPNNNFFTILINTQGNLNIRPQIINSVELSYLHAGYYFSINYSYVSKPRVDLPTQNQDSGITIMRYVTNLKHTRNLNFNISLPVKISKWWQTHSNLSLANPAAILLNGEKESDWFFTLNSGHTFFLNSRSKAELNFFYNSGSRFGYSKFLSSTGLSLGYKLTIKKDKCDLSFNINDLLGTNKFRMVSDYDYQLTEMKSLKNNRFFRITLTYLFNTGNKFSLRSNSSKADFGEKRY